MHHFQSMVPNSTFYKKSSGIKLLSIFCISIGEGLFFLICYSRIDSKMLDSLIIWIKLLLTTTYICDIGPTYKIKFDMAGTRFWPECRNEIPIVTYIPVNLTRSLDWSHFSIFIFIDALDKWTLDKWIKPLY